MLRSLLFTITFGFAAAIINSELDQHWELWKKVHNKVYSHQVRQPGRICFDQLNNVITKSSPLGICGLYYVINVKAASRLRSWVAGRYGNKIWK